MATRTNKVEVEIVATDEATPKIDRLEAKIEGLEADEARIVVTSNIDRTNQQLDAARKKLEALDGDEATVQARLVGNLEEDLEQATKLFEQLDGQTGTVRMQLDDQTMRDGTRRASEGLDQVARSGAASKSVLANMVGNSVQDVGQLGGIAGSAGVAIGQMAERMADARAEGESFGTIARNFGAVLGPIAALATAIGIVTNALSEQKAAAEASEAATKLFGKSLEGAGDDSLTLADSLRDNSDLLTKFDVDAADFSAALQENLATVARGIPLVGGLLGDMGKNITDLTPIMQRAGFSIHDFADAIAQGGIIIAGPDGWTAQLIAAMDAGKITADEFNALSQAIGDYGQDVEASRLILQAFTIDQGEANAMLEQALALKDPLKAYSDQFASLVRDMKAGAGFTQESTDAINFLSDVLGIGADKIIAIAQAEADRQNVLEANRKAAIGYTTAQNLVNESIEQALEDVPTLAELERDAAEAAREEADAHRDVADALQDQLDARRSAADATFALHDAERSFVEDTAKLNEELDKAKNLYEARAVLDDYAQSAGKVADSQVRIAEETAAANGQVLSATERTDIWNQAMITAATTMDGPGRDAIVRYIASVNNIPEQTVTKISALLDQNKWSEARRLLEGASQTRDTAIEVDVETAQAEGKLDEFIRKPRGPIEIPVRIGQAATAGATADQLERIAGGPVVPTRAGNVTIINAPGTPTTTVGQVDTFQARNGVR